MQIESNYEFLVKIIIIGDSGVGKTNFMFRFADNTFNSLHVSTVGLDYKSKIIILPSSKKKVKIQIWDTVGQERYMALNKSSFQKVQGIIIMYDLTDRKSFENIDKWLNIVSQNFPGKSMILVANKLDLSDEKRIVTEEEGQKLAEENNVKFFEGSGQTGENVEEIFTELAEMIYENIVNDKDSFQSPNKKLAKNNQGKKKKCCK